VTKEHALNELQAYAESLQEALQNAVQSHTAYVKQQVVVQQQL